MYDGMERLIRQAEHSGYRPEAKVTIYAEEPAGRVARGAGVVACAPPRFSPDRALLEAADAAEYTIVDPRGSTPHEPGAVGIERKRVDGARPSKLVVWTEQRLIVPDDPRQTGRYVHRMEFPIEHASDVGFAQALQHSIETGGQPIRPDDRSLSRALPVTNVSASAKFVGRVGAGEVVRLQEPELDVNASGFARRESAALENIARRRSSDISRLPSAASLQPADESPAMRALLNQARAQLSETQDRLKGAERGVKLLESQLAHSEELRFADRAAIQSQLELIAELNAKVAKLGAEPGDRAATVAPPLGGRPSPFADARPFTQDAA